MVHHATDRISARFSIMGAAPDLPRALVDATRAAEHARDVGASVTRHAHAVAENARAQVSRVASTAQAQLTHVLEVVGRQARRHARAQVGQAVEGLDRVGAQLRALAAGRPEQAGPLADQAWQLGEHFSGVSRALEGGGLEALLASGARIARLRRVFFVLGATVACLGVGRLARGRAPVKVPAPVAAPYTAVDPAALGAGEPVVAGDESAGSSQWDVPLGSACPHNGDRGAETNVVATARRATGTRRDPSTPDERVGREEVSR